MAQETKTLKEEIINRLDRSDNKLELATSILILAKQGDKTALALVSKLMDEKTVADAEKAFPLNDEQFKQVILIAADRIRSAA